MDLFPENEGVVLLGVGDKFSIELGKISNHIPVISSFVESTQDTRYFFPFLFLDIFVKAANVKSILLNP